MSQKHWNSNEFNARLTQDTAWTNASLQASPGTGFRNYVTDIVIDCGATSRTFSLLDGSGGTVLFKFTPAANTSVHAHLQVPLRLTAATALCLTSSGASVGAFVGVNGFVAR